MTDQLHQSDPHHVHDLEVNRGWYVCAGLNCRFKTQTPPAGTTEEPSK